MDIPPEEAIVTVPSYPVLIKGKTVKTLRSIITGEEAPIIGYAFKASPELIAMSANEKLRGTMVTIHQDDPYVSIELISRDGCSGHLFVDEYGRLYSLHGGETMDDPYSERMKKAFFERFHRYPKGVATLSGVIELQETD